MNYFWLGTTNYLLLLLEPDLAELSLKREELSFAFVFVMYSLLILFDTGFKSPDVTPMDCGF